MFESRNSFHFAKTLPCNKIEGLLEYLQDETRNGGSQVISELASSTEASATSSPAAPTSTEATIAPTSTEASVTSSPAAPTSTEVIVVPPFTITSGKCYSLKKPVVSNKWCREVNCAEVYVNAKVCAFRK
eukprot:Awhi_evm1s14606